MSAIRALAILFASTLSIIALADGTSYPMTGWPLTADDKAEEWFKACMRVASVEVPPADLAASKLMAEQQASDAECNTYEMMWAELSKPEAERNWESIRACAYMNDNRMTLATLYANGWGVKQNVDVALKLICSNSRVVDQDVDGLIDYLKDPAANGPEFIPETSSCDGGTTGAADHCASTNQAHEDRQRQYKFNHLISNYTVMQRKAYEQLVTAEQAFVRVRSSSEIDLTGTLRDQYIMSIEDEENDRLLKHLSDIEGGELPPTKVDAAKADGELNAEYQRIRLMLDRKHSGAESAESFGTVRWDGIRKTQRAWLAYRDAWVSFGALRQPSVPKSAWIALFTRERIPQLERLRNGCVYPDDDEDCYKQ